jgi:DNA-3-methyladenine glycosylase II
VTVRFTILPKRPYSLALTAERYTRFPEVVDRFDGGVYRRLLPVGSGGVLLTVAQEGPPARAALAIRLDGARAGSEGARIAARRVVETALGAATDIAPFYRAYRSDPVLGDPIRAFRGLRVAGAPSLWEALVTAVLAQQVNLKFACDIRRELSLAYGRRARFGGEEFVAFPSPESLAKEGLRGCGASASRDRRPWRSVGWRGHSTAERSPRESLGASDEEAIARLTALRGVRRWTAEIGLLRSLGRTDIFPAGDLGVVKYLAQGCSARGEGRGRHAALCRAAGRRTAASPWSLVRRAQSAESSTSSAAPSPSRQPARKARGHEEVRRRRARRGSRNG